VLVDVLLVLDELVLELLLQLDALVAGLRQAVDGVHHEMEAVEIVQHRHVKGRGDGTRRLRRQWSITDSRQLASGGR
jgi:hypothetical protein